MSAYDPGVFSKRYESSVGLDLWIFLNEADNIIRMETATALGRPAVEGLEEPLLDRFGADVLEKRTKQMIGHMVRQIMEGNGYAIDVQNVKVTNGAPFSRATRYKLPGDMIFHVFRNSKDPRNFALTSDKAGSELKSSQPVKDTKWSYWKSFRGGLRGRIAFKLEDEAVARADIAEKGYHLYTWGRILRKG